MKKAFRIASEIATGIAATATLLAGRAMGLSVSEGVEAARADGMPTELIGDNGIFNRITSLILLVIGAVSVIMLIIGGFRYIVSGGDAKKVADAKNTILYAIIGLIISLLAAAIVRFVIQTFVGSTPTWMP